MAKRANPPWTPFAPASFPELTALQRLGIAKVFGVDPAVVDEAARQNTSMFKVVKNSRYTVAVRETRALGQRCFHLSIKRNDRRPQRSWADLQRIKNELIGDEAEGVEIFPAESRLLDTATQYHLWVWPRDDDLPYLSAGFFDGRVVVDEAEPGATHSQVRPHAEVSPATDMAARAAEAAEFNRIQRESESRDFPSHDRPDLSSQAVTGRD